MSEKISLDSSEINYLNTQNRHEQNIIARVCLTIYLEI